MTEEEFIEEFVMWIRTKSNLSKELANIEAESWLEINDFEEVEEVYDYDVEAIVDEVLSYWNY